jgi:hypothetical protein
MTARNCLACSQCAGIAHFDVFTHESCRVYCKHRPGEPRAFDATCGHYDPADRDTDVLVKLDRLRNEG